MIWVVVPWVFAAYLGGEYQVEGPFRVEGARSKGLRTASKC